MYWIHLSTAQDAGLEFWQTGSNAIITYQSVPKECVVKVVSESGKPGNLHLDKDQKQHSETPGFIRAPTFCASLGKPRASSRCGTLTQFHQGVAVGQTNVNNLLIFDSTASLTTKFTSTSRTSSEASKHGKNFKRRLT